VDAAAERMFGYTAGEVVGRSITLIIPPERLSEEQEVLSRIRSGHSVEHYETWRRRKDGALVPISLTVSPIRDDQGRVIGASKIARDVSDRLHAQEALAEAQRRQRDLQNRLVSLVAASSTLFESPKVEDVMSATRILRRGGRDRTRAQQSRRGCDFDGGAVRRAAHQPRAGRALQAAIGVSRGSERRAGELARRMARPPASARRRQNLAGIRALVIDDDGDTRDLLAEVLRGSGVQVALAASAGEGLEAFERERPDVIVSDLAMPETDGFELIRRIRALPSDRGGGVPAVAVTAYARAEDSERSLSSGFQAHVTKPIDSERLLSTIADLAGRTPSAA